MERVEFILSLRSARFEWNRLGLRHRIQAIVTDVSPHQAQVVLFHKAIVVLLKGAAAGKFHPFDPALGEFEQESIEKLTAVVRVELHQGERKPIEEALKAYGPVSR
jgi:hypothetical protein